jgi:murein DD-endopeptidase MepM/ murein hydrolase activator NlpD
VFTPAQSFGVIALILCVFVTCLAGAYALGNSHRSSVEMSELDEESLEALKKYVDAKVSHSDLEAQISKQSQEELMRLREGAEKRVDAKVRLLADEFLRIRTYEKQLESRATFLQTILDSVLELDFIEPNQESASLGVENEIGVDGLGIGGGYESSSPLFNLYPDSSTAKRRTSKPQGLLSQLDSHITTVQNIPMGIPIRGRISSNFGRRRSPFSGRTHLHRGIDVAVARKSRVSATADGFVAFAGYKGGYGRTVIIDHGNGIETLYGHLSKITVKNGERVCREEKIGLVGSSGRSTGPHLHYEVRVNGKPKDPRPFIDLASSLRYAGL